MRVAPNVQESSRGLSIEIPPPRDGSVTRYSIAMLLSVLAIGTLAFLGASFPNVWVKGFFLVFVLGFTTLTLFALVWNLWRREVVAVTESSLTVERSLFGLHGRWTQQVPLTKGTELVIDPQPRIMRKRLDVSTDFGPLLFETDDDLFRFGEGLTEEDAAALADRIGKKFPQITVRRAREDE